MTRDVNDESNFCKTLEEQLKRLFHLYKSKIKQFNIIFSLLIALGVFFFFIILLPYISIHIEKETISEQQRETLHEINELNDKIVQVNNGIYIVRQSNNLFELLYNKIIHGPEDLRSFAVNLWLPNSSQTAQQDTVHKQFQSCSMITAGTYEWLDCNLRTKTLSQLDGYKQLLHHNITIPVLMAGEELLEEKDRIALKEQLDDVQQLLVEKFENQKKETKKYPQIFTLTMSGNAEVNIIFNEMFLDSWNKYEQIIGTQNNRLKHLVSKIQYNLDKEEDPISDLQNEKKRLQQTANELLNEIEQIDFRSKQPVIPFLSVFVRELIPLYPMSLALGFLVSISILRDIYKLRRAVHQLYKKKYSDNDIIVDKHFIINAPLWIDPLNLTQNHITRSFILLIPFLLFLITLIMMLYIWFFINDTFNFFLDMTYFGTIMYGWILYTLSIGLFTYSFYIIIIEYTQCRRSNLKKNNES
jgi:hypothetical protein